MFESKLCNGSPLVGELCVLSTLNFKHALEKLAQKVIEITLEASAYHLTPFADG